MAKKTTKKPKPGQVPQTVAFRFRAETITDIFNFLAELKIDRCLRIEITPVQAGSKDRDWAKGIPDLECTLLLEGVTETQLLQAMRKVDDAHVMIQTLMPLGAYDGERRRSRKDA
jgi:hypothetical protein